jgi:hypothetical protein
MQIISSKNLVKLKILLTPRKTRFICFFGTEGVLSTDGTAAHQLIRLNTWCTNQCYSGCNDAIWNRTQETRMHSKNKRLKSTARGAALRQRGHLGPLGWADGAAEHLRNATAAKHGDRRTASANMHQRRTARKTTRKLWIQDRGWRGCSPPAQPQGKHLLRSEHAWRSGPDLLLGSLAWPRADMNRSLTENREELRTRTEKKRPQKLLDLHHNTRIRS